ncbi:hypothetical protein CHUV2995_00620 [Corynebacterium diphtheriae subsp. lausannense]|nr:hypothetical protein CHUV2995_00620 [Corynebacterium diphtheriae subsp. lausannense]
MPVDAVAGAFVREDLFVVDHAIDHGCCDGLVTETLAPS